MLNKMVGFVTTTSPERARGFYGDTLGFRFLEDDGFALSFDASGTLQRTVEESSTIEYNDSSIVIVRSEGQQMKGTISTAECDWKVPYKNGRTYIKSTMVDERGESRNLNITIEGKDGTISFLAESPQNPDRKIRLVIDKFEEKK